MKTLVTVDGKELKSDADYHKLPYRASLLSGGMYLRISGKGSPVEKALLTTLVLVTKEGKPEGTSVRVMAMFPEPADVRGSAGGA